MPESSGRCARLAVGVRLALCAWLFAACSGGSSGGGGGAAATVNDPPPADETSSVTLAWGAASGPVAGYSVYVQRDGGSFDHELDVSETKVTLSGPPGQQARVSVAAFDRRRAHGPGSRPSPIFTFPSLPDPEPPADDGAEADDGSGSDAPADDPVAGNQDPGSDGDGGEPEPPDAAALAGRLVWQAGDGLRLTDAAIETTRLFARPADGAQLAAVADFDADGQGDLLWVGVSGELGYMPGSALRGSDPIALVDLGALPADERVIGAGDFDGDGYGDVLVANADAIRARLTPPNAAPALVDLGTAAQAVLAGIADFDANGSDDIAWRSGTGAFVLWLMHGGNVDASVEVALATDFELMGLGDFDGNGAAELTVRGPHGYVFVVHPLAALPELEATDLANTQEWQAFGAVDLDRDGSEELVLAGTTAIRIASLPGDELVALDPDAPWQLIALLP